MTKASRKITVPNLSLYDKNANKGTKIGKQLLAESLKELGAGRSMACDRNYNIPSPKESLQPGTTVICLQSFQD